MREASNGTSLREHVLLFSRFLRSPRTVGAVTPSSRATAEAMVADLDFGETDHVVELGPGTGVFTAAILEQLKPGSKLLAVEIDPAFVERVQRRWPAVACVCGSAEDLDTIVDTHEMLPVDHILSGLPFVSLPLPVTQKILESIAKVLRPGGTFTTFQYLHAYGLPSATAFRARMREKMNSSPEIRLVIRNFPPALILTWTKTEH
jgi:phospholipid N-methyltransferase